MSVVVAIAGFVCNTSTGNQDLTTTDLGGLTPVGAWFSWARKPTEGNGGYSADGANMGFGAATATDEQWCIAVSSEDGQSPSDTYRRGAQDECVMYLNPADGTVDGEAAFVSFITNGVRINWGNAPSDAWILFVTFYAGTGVSAHADTFNDANTVNTAVDVTDPGFEPDAVLLASMHGNINDTTGSLAALSYGVAVNDGSDTQASIAWTSRDNANPTGIAVRITDDYGISYVSGFGNPAWAGEITDWDSNGFSCYSRLGGGGNRGIGYLALAFDGEVYVGCGTMTTPTSTGNDSQTGPGFTPQHVHLGICHAQAVDTSYVNSDAEDIGVGLFDDDDEYCIGIYDEDNVNPTNTSSITDTNGHTVRTSGFVAAFVSFDTNGWTLNFTTTLGAARYWWWFAVSEEISVTGSPWYTYAQQ